MPNYLIALAYVIGAYILSYVAIFIFDKITHLASKTKTTLDDKIIGSLHRPIKFIFLLVGLYLGLRSIDPNLTINGFEVFRIFIILGILLGAYVISRVLKAVFLWYGEEISARTKTDIDDTLFPFLRKALSMIIYIVAGLLTLESLGIEIGPLLAGLGIAGLAVALALQDTLSNFFSGIYLSIDRPIKVGDFIELESGLKGFVHDIGWRSTKIRTLPNNFVVVPNETLSKSVITNYNTPENEMSVVLKVGVSYDSDLDQVEKVTIDVAKKVLEKIEGGTKHFEPFIRYNEFADSSINFSVILRVNTFVDQYLVSHEFHKALKKRFDKEKIEIPYPQMDIHKRK